MSKQKKPITFQRNFHACHPIMRKGGVHEKSKSAKRAAAKRETRQKAREWLGRSSLGWLYRLAKKQNVIHVACLCHKLQASII